MWHSLVVALHGSSPVSAFARCLTTIAFAICTPAALHAQTTAFVYQGKLTDAGNPANGNFDMQFKLYDALSGGVQQGSTLTRDPVAVTAGVFSVMLDFNANVFTGSNRWLEISVRPDGSANPHTPLAPRQPVLSSPYAIQTLNTQQLGGLAANRYLASDANGKYLIGSANPLFGKLHVEGGGDNAVYGTSSSGEGIYGTSSSGRGVRGYSASSIGVWGASADFEGVRGEAHAVGHGAVVGLHSGGGIGVYGSSTAFAGSAGTGVQGSTETGRGVIGTSTSGTGVYGFSSGVGASGAGVYGGNNAVGGYGVMGEANSTTSIGVVGVSGTSSGYGMYARNLFGGRALYAEGHVGQALYGGGIAKAMLEFWGNTITRCFNGQTLATANACGFSFTSPLTGVVRLNFGFTVNDRFVAITPMYDSALGATNNIGANYRFFSASELEVFTFLSGSTDLINAGFMVIVF